MDKDCTLSLATLKESLYGIVIVPFKPYPTPTKSIQLSMTPSDVWSSQKPVAESISHLPKLNIGVVQFRVTATVELNGPPLFVGTGGGGQELVDAGGVAGDAVGLSEVTAIESAGAVLVVLSLFGLLLIRGLFADWLLEIGSTDALVESEPGVWVAAGDEEFSARLVVLAEIESLIL